MNNSVLRRNQIKLLGFFILLFFLTIKFSENIIPLNDDFSQIGEIFINKIFLFFIFIVTNFFIPAGLLVECKSGSCNKQINNIENDKHFKTLGKTTNSRKKNKNTTLSFTIVTGASANHFCELQSWLYYMSETLKELRKEYKPRMIVYDLGMVEYQKKVLKLLEKKGEYFNEIREFNFDKYPKFWDINENRGEYAWKAGIIKEVSMEYPGIIIWLDSGSFLSERFFTMIEELLIQYNGFISPKSSGKLLEWTHPGVFKYFKQEIKGYINKNYDNCNGAAIIFDTNKTQYLIDQWYKCALVKKCIAPEGSNRDNHRQDQAILTYLIINDNRLCNYHKSFFGLKTHMDDYCARNIYYYDKLHGEFYWPSREDLEEINKLKELYADHVIYDIWSEGALEMLLSSFTEHTFLKHEQIEAGGK